MSLWSDWMCGELIMRYEVCAEAYSRMAQVQQYLDPSTREQYAQGHLDQRVEQVLQEIRDLSIAGAT